MLIYVVVSVLFFIALGIDAQSTGDLTPKKGGQLALVSLFLPVWSLYLLIVSVRTIYRVYKGGLYGV